MYSTCQFIWLWKRYERIVVSDSTLGHLYSKATTQRKLAVYTAVLVAIPVVYITELTGLTQTGGLPVLLILLVIGVPETYGKHWPQYERTRKTVAWTLAACLLVTLEFVCLYIILTGYEIQPTVASLSAALLVIVLNIVWMVSKHGYLATKRGSV